MKIQEKVMVFITRTNINTSGFEWLALHNNGEDPKHGGSRWYVVTGNVDKGESLEQAAKREVREETGITQVVKLVSLSVKYEYESKWHKDMKFCEHGFLLITDSNDKIVLNEEHTEYKWLNLEDFSNEIWWTESRKKLRLMLMDALQK